MSHPVQVLGIKLGCSARDPPILQTYLQPPIFVTYIYVYAYVSTCAYGIPEVSDSSRAGDTST